VSEAPIDAKDGRFAELYRGHAADVYRYSLALVRDPLDAEDVTQATFLNALEAYDEHPPRKPGPWLIAIARNICFERFRQALRRPQLVPLHEVPATTAHETGPRAGDVVAALRGVPRRQRAVLVLDGLEGRSRAEIAAALGIGEATVSGLLARGRNNLRLQLDQGMTCERARALQPRLWGTGVSRSERRAVIAHLRNCEDCADLGAATRGLSGLLGVVWLGARGVGEPVARLAASPARLVEAVGGVGGAVVTKTAVVASVGALAGSVAWHESGQLQASPRSDAPVAAKSPGHRAPRSAAQPAGVTRKRVVQTGGDTRVVSIPRFSAAHAAVAPATHTRTHEAAAFTAASALPATSPLPETRGLAVAPVTNGPRVELDDAKIASPEADTEVTQGTELAPARLEAPISPNGKAAVPGQQEQRRGAQEPPGRGSAPHGDGGADRRAATQGDEIAGRVASHERPATSEQNEDRTGETQPDKPSGPTPPAETGPPPAEADGETGKAALGHEKADQPKGVGGDRTAPEAAAKVDVQGSTGNGGAKYGDASGRG
jgi:RNA polymerase sigma-70 factor (ECF subfamily)